MPEVHRSDNASGATSKRAATSEVSKRALGGVMRSADTEDRDGAMTVCENQNFKD